MTIKESGITVVVLSVVAGFPVTGRAESLPSPVHLFEGMGSHHRAVTTASPKAQRYFDQALIWAFAFNHDEAIRSFREVARLDPACAMAWWGVALCNGPHINNPAMSDEQSRAASDAIRKARQLQTKASPIEQALIAALARRYADPPPKDRRPLDEAYAAAMSDIWRASPEDVDVGVLYAEAMMDLQPWDLWTKDGRPKGRTPEIIAVLEEVLKNAPNHPGACHLYVHAIEASPDPGKAAAAADRLRRLVPASGHLVHMPSHIDVRTGRWADAADQNVAAMEVDRKYRTLSPRQGFYHVYMAHDPHFLAFASMMEGRSAAALQAARRTIAGIPADFIEKNPALVEQFMPIVLEVLKRFGRWDDILQEPAPPTYLPVTTAMRYFVRGIAYAAKGEVEAAAREQAAFRESLTKVPPEAVIAINQARKVLSIADHTLEGEIAFRRNRIDDAVRELREAIRIEDDLQYMEPPDWLQPVRHTLGAVLVSAGRHQEAEVVYREDLQRWPENGWSLHGLAECLRARSDASAREIDQRFRKAWARSDTRIASSCLCVATAHPAASEASGQGQ